MGRGLGCSGGVFINNKASLSANLFGGICLSDKPYITTSEWIALILVDAQGRVLAFNKEFADWQHKPSSEMIQRAIKTFAPRNLTQRITEALQEVHTTRQARIFTTRHKNRLLEVRLTPLLHQDEMRQVIITLLDITTRHALSSALEASEERFRTTLMSIGDAVITTDTLGRIVTMNPVAETLTGWNEDQARGKPLERIFHIVNEESKAPVENPVSRVLREGVVIGLGNHTLLIDRQGKEIPIADSGAPILDDHGKIQGVVLVFRDQTEERRAQKALEQARLFAESIVATVREPLLVLDAELRVLAANDAFYHTFQTHPKETEGRKIYELGNRQWDIPELRHLLEHILPNNTSFDDFEVTHRFENIGHRNMLLNARRIHYHGEKTDFILLAIEDITARRQAESSLREQQELFRLLTERAHDLIYRYEFSPRRGFTYVSPSATQMTGYTPEEHYADPDLGVKIVYPDDRPKLQEYFEGKGAFNEPITLRWVHKDGHIFFAEQVNVPIYDAEGRLIAIEGVVRDVTERMHLIQAIQESEARARFFMEHTLEGIVIHENGIIVDVNKRGLEMSGYSYEELMGKSVLALAAPQSHALIMEKVKSNFEGAYEAVGMRKDGSTFPCELLARQTEWQGRTVRVVIVRDLTERKTAEEALRKSEESFRSLYENATIGIYRSTPDGRILLANPSLVRMLGFDSFEELAEHNLEQELFATDEARERFRRLLERQGEIRGMEASWTKKDGTTIFIRESARVVRDAEGNILYYEGTTEDITEHKRQQRELEALAMVSRAVAEERALRPLLERILEAARHAIPAGEKGSILLLDEKGRLHIRALIGYQDERIYSMTFAEDAGYSALVARQRQAMYFKNVRTDARVRYDGDIEEARSIMSAIAAPLIVQERLIGVISLDNATRPEAFNEEDLRTLTSFASTAALIIDNARLFEHAQLQARRQEALYRLSTNLAKTLNVSEICAQVIRTLGDELGYPFAGVFLIDPRTGDRVLQAQHGWEDVPKEWRLRPGQGVSRHAVETGELHYWPNAPQQPDYIPGRPDTYSEVDVPIRAGETVIGVLIVEHPEVDAFSPEDFDLLKSVANLLGIVLENARLFEQANRHIIELQALYETAVDLSRESRLETLLEALVWRAAQLFNVPVGGVYLYDESTEELEMSAVCGITMETTHRLKLGEGMAGKVAQTRQPLIVEDYRYWEGRSPQYEGVPFSSVLEVPMIYMNTLVGVLVVNEMAPHQRTFTQADVELLSSLAAYAAGAVQTARLLRQTQQQVEELQTLYATTLELSRTIDTKRLLESLAKRAAQLFNAPISGIYLYDELHQELELSAVHGLLLKPGLRLKLGEGMAGKVAQARQPLVVEDYQHWAGRSAKLEGQPFTSAVEVPMLYMDNLIGVLLVSEIAPAKRIFNQREVELLSLLASYAAGAVHNARLMETIQRRLLEVETLRHTSEALATLDTSRVLQIVAENAKALFQADGCRVFILQEDGETLECVIALHQRAEQVKAMRIKLGVGVTGSVLAKGEAEIVNDMLSDPRTLQVPGTPVEDEAMMFVPLQVHGNPSGVISVSRLGKERPFTPRELELFKALAMQASAALENAHMFADVQMRLQELHALQETALAMASLDFKEVLEIVGKSAARLFDADDCLIFLHEDQSDRLRCIFAFSTYEEAILGLELKLGEGIAGSVALSGEAEIVNRPLEDPRAVQIPGTPVEEECLMFAPLVHGDETIGVISLSRKGAQRIFHSDDLALLRTLAAHATTAIIKARYFSAAQSHAHKLELLNALAGELAAALDLESIGVSAHTYLHQLVGCDVFVISTYHEETQSLQPFVVIDHGEKVEATSVAPYPLQGENHLSPHAQALNLIQCVLLQELDAATIRPLGSWIDVHHPPTSALFEPIVLEGKAIGLMELYSHTPLSLTEEDKELFATIAMQVGLAIRKVQLFHENERKIRQLNALHKIDIAIASSMDMHLSLYIICEQILAELGISAAIVWSFRPHLQSLQFVLSRGLTRLTGSMPNLSLMDDLCGRAVVERQIIMRLQPEAEYFSPKRRGLIAEERFAFYAALPLLAKGEVKGVLEVFDKKVLSPDKDWWDFLEGFAHQTAIAIDNAQLFSELEKSRVELAAAYDATIEGWSKAMDLRDHETEGHSLRVADLSAQIARKMGFTPEEVMQLRRGALLHDLGKLAIPERILHKTSELSPEEWDLFRKHPQIAYDMLVSIEYLRPSLTIPLYHHEKWDGSGYPFGLQGEQIPLAARIFAVVDVFDALTSDRPYRPAWSKSAALEYIREQAGKHFDPKVVEVFLSIIGAQ